MGVSSPTTHAARFAGLVGLALAALACAPGGPVRHQLLSERLERLRPVASTSFASGDALFARTSVLERAALVRAVLERNPDVEAARQAVHAALARHPQEKSLEDPMLGIGAAPLSFGSSRVDAAGRIDLSQRFPFPGKRRLRGEAALFEAEASGSDLESLRLDLALLATTLLEEHRLAALALAINAEHERLLDELHALALARYGAGQDEKGSVLSAELERARTRYQRTELASSAQLVVARINGLLHRRPDLSLPPASSDEPGHPREPAGPGSHMQLVDRALGARPELAAAAAREQAAAARVALAQREFLPDFTLIGAYDGLWQESPLAPFVGLQLNLPLQLGRRRAALEESRALLAVSQHRRLALEQDVRLAVETAALRVEQAREGWLLIRDQLLPAAREQVATARTAYATGTAGIPALIDAIGELHEIELAYAEASTRTSQRDAELERALGRLAGLEGRRP